MLKINLVIKGVREDAKKAAAQHNIVIKLTDNHGDGTLDGGPDTWAETEHEHLEKVTAWFAETTKATMTSLGFPPGTLLYFTITNGLCPHPSNKG